MARKNWEKIASNQFSSLDKEIQDDWNDLRELTLKNR